MTTDTETTGRMSETEFKRLQGLRANALSMWGYPDRGFGCLHSCVTEDMPILFTHLRAAYAEIDAKDALIKTQRLALENTYQIARRISKKTESAEVGDSAGHIMRFAREALPASAFSVLRDATEGDE
jgi:hypothetical protein